MSRFARRVGPVCGTLVLSLTAALHARQTMPAATSTAPAERLLYLNFVDAPLDDVLNGLAEGYGFAVVKTAPLRGNVTLVSHDAVNATQAIALLKDILGRVNQGLVVTHSEPPNDHYILRVISANDARRVQIPVYSGNDPAKIEDSDRLITQIIPLKSVDAVRLRTDIAPLLSPDADLAVSGASNSIIVTDSSSKIKHLVEILRRLDQTPNLTLHVENLKLEYANAADVARLINDIFNPQNTGTSNPEGQGNNPAGPGIPGAAELGLGGVIPEPPGGLAGVAAAATQPSSSRDGKIFASSDARTNNVVVAGPEVLVKMVMNLIRQVDQPPYNDTVLFIYNLRNAQAADLQQVLSATFGNTTAPGGGAAGGFGGGGGGGGGGIGAAANGLAGQAYVVANTDTNSLLVMTKANQVDRVREILDGLDRAVPQVLLQVLVAQVNLANTSDLGLEFTFPNQGASGVTTSTDFGLAAASGGLKIGLVQTQATATLRALASKNKIDVLSRPYLLSQDNQEAEFTVGQQIPYITNSQITAEGDTVNSVGYAQIGVTIDFIPHINPDGQVTMDLETQISQLDAGSGVPISSNVFAPIFDTLGTQARVAVKNGQTVVIGGLMQDQLTEQVNKIPILGDLPLVGNLFKHTVKTKNRQELMIFITPQVAIAPELLKHMTDEQRKDLKLVPNSVQPGEFQSQLLHMGNKGSQGTSPPPLMVVPMTPATAPATLPATRGAGK